MRGVKEVSMSSQLPDLYKGGPTADWNLFNEYMVYFRSIWPLILTLLPTDHRDKNRDYVRKPGGGRKATDPWILFRTILFVLCTGIQWNAVLKNDLYGFCSGKVANKWHLIWARTDFYKNLCKTILQLYDAQYKLDIEWTSLDGSNFKAPLGLEEVGPNPTDRGKNGTKRSILVDTLGIILAFVHAAANVHDSNLLEQTLAARMDKKNADQENLCLDAGYVGDRCKKTAESFGYITHVRPRGEEKKLKETDKTYDPKRWVVERTHAWLNNFRKLRIRYEKTIKSFDGLTFVAALTITTRIMFRLKEGLNIWKKGTKKMNVLSDEFINKCSGVGKNILELAVNKQIIAPIS